MNRKIALAVLMSFVIPGLGQIYNEDLTKGGVILIASILGFFFFGIGYLVLWLWSIADAYLRARHLHAEPEQEAA